MGKYSDGDAGGGGGSYPLVAVCIDKDKNSQNALKYATETLVHRGQTLVLVHVNTRGSSGGVEDAAGYKQPTDPQMKDLFLPFRCFCTRKDIQCKDVLLDDHDVAKSLVEFAAHAAVERLVLGANTRSSFVRFKPDVPNSVCKTAPDFTSVYVVNKGGKVTSVRQAIRPAPSVSPLRNMIQGGGAGAAKPPEPQQLAAAPAAAAVQKWAAPQPPQATRADSTVTPSLQPQENFIMSPFSRGPTTTSARKFPDFSQTESSDISFIGAPTQHRSVDRSGGASYQPRLSTGSDTYDHNSFEAPRSGWGLDTFGSESTSNSHTSVSSSLPAEDMEAEMRRLRLELKQTMDMYSTACKEALTAKQKATELQRWKEEEQRSQDGRLTEETALALIEQEKAKARAAIEAAEASQRLAELEAQKRIAAERRALKGDAGASSARYRRYTIEEIEAGTEHFSDSLKVGEGGYGPVYKGQLDHTPVAIKVLRPDAAQGKAQFQQEVEVLSCIRHPNMVLLLGACPEYGCLVYEYMAMGSLDDCLFKRGGGPVLPWQHRFRIAAEIATGLLFLHQAKPEPLVHRDLKPGNILLDRNYVSKISDVGLARLVPPSVADTVTQCHMTSAAGTFCYIDPEYQQTGMLGVKSDVYSLGVMLLQIITARPPMGLTHHVARALDHGTIADLLDPAVHDWPVDEARRFAEMSLRCCELRRKDRPDLATGVLPELNRLRALGEDNMQFCNPMMGGMGSMGGGGGLRTGMTSSAYMSNPSMSQSRNDQMSDPFARSQYGGGSTRRPNYN
ncbi:U-box domain-containing protein 52-like [Triticum dicoccoides]|uniref:U-box domain-containing protein 52-like n=1 Tax=Triticum dicoccoides TaxID=85692 RepID=UPI001890C509|nr:U-box domain-containing protein 52-like [Triticum dicoccoides]